MYRRMNRLHENSLSTGQRGSGFCAFCMLDSNPPLPYVVPLSKWKSEAPPCSRKFLLWRYPCH
jgi:hypothetical protein